MARLLLTLVGAVVGLMLAGAVMAGLVPFLIDAGGITPVAEGGSEWTVWAVLIACVGLGAIVGFAIGGPRPKQYD